MDGNFCWILERCIRLGEGQKMGEGGICPFQAFARGSAALPEQLQHVLGWAADEGAVSFDDDGALEEDGVRCDGGEDFCFGTFRRKIARGVFVFFGAEDFVGV